MSGPGSLRRVDPPRAWLGLAFLAVWLYLVSQLLRIFPNGISAAFDLTAPEARQVLAITSGLGQIGLFAGLVAALWRANLAAGVSKSGVRGLGLGILGVGLLAFFELALFLDWIRLPLGGLAGLVRSPALDAGIIAGTALVFAGLASLGVGLARAVDLFGRGRAEVPPPAATRSEETG
jgi:hypothetical protein